MKHRTPHLLQNVMQPNARAVWMCGAWVEIPEPRGRQTDAD